MVRQSQVSASFPPADLYYKREYFLNMVYAEDISILENPESGFRFFAGICLYWISLVSYSFLSLVQGIFHVEIIIFDSLGLHNLYTTPNYLQSI